MKKESYQPVDESARALARELMASAHHAALAVTLADGTPMVTRVAIGVTTSGLPVSLISDLSSHTEALRARPAASVLIGEPGPKGDPLTHPRLTIQVTAEFVAGDNPTRPEIRAKWLADHPKSRLYVDFADFAFVRLMPQSALLNGGFGKAFKLMPEDLLFSNQ